MEKLYLERQIYKMNYNEEKHSQAAILGLQHLLAMYSGSILVPIMIAGALGYSAEQ